MRLIEIDLRAYGPFTGKVLELGPRLAVIYGPNEAGKTSALRALRCLLYGIPVQTTDSFRHVYKDLRIGATLEHSDDGTRLTCIRRKANKDSLRGADDDQCVEEGELGRLLGGLTEDLFESMFGIDHATLVQGGKSIVAGHGDIGPLLFAAGAGIADVRAVQEGLKNDAERLFTPTGKNPPINKRLSEWKEARKAIKLAQVPSAQWVQHDRAYQEAVQNRSLIERDLAEAESERHRLERFQRALPAVAARYTLVAELEKLVGVPLLRKEFTVERVAMVEALGRARQAAQTACAAVELLDGDIVAIQVPEALLRHAAAIERLQQELGSHQTAMDHRPGLEGQRRQLEALSVQSLRRLRPEPELALPDAAELRLTAAEHEGIEELANRYDALAAQEQASADRLVEIKDQVREQQQRLAALPPPGHAETQEWPVVPAPDAIEGFRERIAAAEKDAKTADARCTEEQGQVADADAELEQLRDAQDVPTEDDLRRARARRDAGWRLVLEAWEQGPAEVDAEREFRSHFPAAGGLAEAFEAGVRQADELADRLRREAGRVERLASLLVDRRKAEQRRDRFAGQLRDAQAKVEELQQEWQALWLPLGITPRSPREMRAWALRRQEIVAELERWQRELPREQAQQRRAQQALADWRGKWAQAVSRIGLDAEASTVQARAVLRVSDELFVQLGKIADLSGRIEGIDQDGRAFAERVRDLVAPLAPDLAGLPAETVAVELRARLTSAQAAEQKLESLRKRREEQALAKAAAERGIAEADVRLAALCREAQVSDLDELPRAEENSASRAEKEKELKANGRELDLVSGGVAVEAFLTAVAAVDADQLGPHVARLEEQIQELNASKAGLADVIAEEKVVLATMDGSAKAAEEAERAEALAAGLFREVEQYARTRLASAVLDRAIERYREKNQDPVLTRASQLFAELTLGAFEGLRTATGNASEVLVGVRAGSREQVAVGEMSDGTADQLYLALRLASLERYLERHEPVPFIVDDILLRFDNARSAATLEVLARLARRTQVIFFTHHEHLVDLARERLPREDWSLHRLDEAADPSTGEANELPLLAGASGLRAQDRLDKRA